MHIFTFTKLKDNQNQYDRSEVILEVRTDHIIRSRLIEEFSNYLKACGYPISGHLEEINENEIVLSKEEYNELLEQSRKS